MRLGLLPAIGGAAPLAVLAVVAQATGRWRDQGCAGVGGSHLPPCVSPAFWHWADVQAVTVAVAAAIGAGIGIALWALAKRERARRHRWGET